MVACPPAGPCTGAGGGGKEKFSLDGAVFGVGVKFDGGGESGGLIGPEGSSWVAGDSGNWFYATPDRISTLETSLLGTPARF